MNTEFFIAKRYLFSKRNVSFITIISAISVIGVTIGVAAMIIVLSVFNGFHNKVSSILIGFDPHIRIESNNSAKMDDYENVLGTVKSLGINNSSPFTLSKGMLSKKNSNKVIFIKGVDEENTEKVSGVKSLVQLGKFDLKNDGDFGSIVLGLALADQLKSYIGDTITILSPVGLEYSLTQFVEPITKEFIVTGIFDSENREYDSKYAYISISNAQNLFKFGDAVSGIEIRLDDINKSDDTKTLIQNSLGDKYNVLTWYDLHLDFYSILKIERWMVFIILSLIIAVASFNILGSLTMTVIEKKRDIGILKAMGASDNTITRIFMFEGLVVGLIGMLAGSFIGAGVILAQKYFEFYKLDSSIYKISALPVMINITDFIFVPLAALLLCFFASLYPARRAAKLNPVESIRWE
ncbi:MAG: FtsX-like permease family protein [Ignavibacteria bacterium]|jgi:lipoprotein-releasing system permease protein